MPKGLLAPALRRPATDNSFLRSNSNGQPADRASLADDSMSLLSRESSLFAERTPGGGAHGRASAATLTRASSSTLEEEHLLRMMPDARTQVRVEMEEAARAAAEEEGT